MTATLSADGAVVQIRPFGHIGLVIHGGRPGRLAAAELRAAMAAPEPVDGFASHRYRVDGLDLHVRERPGGSPAYLLLHGLAVSHRYLMPTARCLPGRRVLVPDLAGFGLSGKPDRIYRVDDHSPLLAAWLDALPERGLCVIGNSFGCQVAVDLAVRRPDLVAALVLVGPTPDPAARSMVRLALRWAYDLVFEDKRQAAILAADVSDAGIRRVLGTLRMSVRDRIDEKLPSLRVPTLFVRGARDRIVPARWLAEAAARTPVARTLTVPRAAHNAVTTAGAEVARAARDAG
jgi:pimeloyl-ACP methyl ester carboxylesterase